MEHDLSARNRRADVLDSANTRAGVRNRGFSVWIGRRTLPFLALVCCWNIRARASHGIWKDPYGRAVISDEPSVWWRLDNATRGGSASCNVCHSSYGAKRGQCLHDQEWCSGSFRTTVSSVIGISGSGVKERAALHGKEVTSATTKTIWDQGDGWAARIDGGAVIQFGADVAIQLGLMDSFSVEVWVRVRTLTPFEQSIFSAGEMRPCDGVNDAICSSPAEGVNHGFEIVVTPDGHLLARIAQLGAVHGGAPSSSAGISTSNNHAPSSSAATAAAACRKAPLGKALMELRGRDTLDLNQWTFIALTLDSRYATLYINARVAAQRRSNVDNGPYVSPKPCRYAHVTIGCSGGPRAFPSYLEGDVDEIAVYNKALTAAQLVAKLAATLYDDNVLTPHSNCSSPPQTHTNPVQSCVAAQEGLKRINRRGNVPSESAAEPAGDEEGARLDEGAADHILQGPEAWPVTSARAAPAGAN